MASGPSVYYGKGENWTIIGLYNQPGEPRRLETFTLNFGFAPTKDAIIGLVVAKCRHPDFAQKWKGWRFVPAMIDEQVYIEPNGSIQSKWIHKNETQLIKIVGG